MSLTIQDIVNIHIGENVYIETFNSFLNAMYALCTQTDFQRSTKQLIKDVLKPYHPIDGRLIDFSSNSSTYYINHDRNLFQNENTYGFKIKMDWERVHNDMDGERYIESYDYMLTANIHNTPFNIVLIYNIKEVNPYFQLDDNYDCYINDICILYCNSVIYYDFESDSEQMRQLALWSNCDKNKCCKNLLHYIFGPTPNLNDILKLKSRFDQISMRYL